MSKSKRKSSRQYAALPTRMVEGRREVLLITSRETGRWVLPKGWPEKRLDAHDLAALEAFEEAGVRGRVREHALGDYTYPKRLRSGRTRHIRVDVFALDVEQELDDWPERAERERRWMSPSQAAMLVDEGGLVSLLLGFGLPET